MATIIKTTGEVIQVAPKNGTDFSAEEIHEVVDGYFQFVYDYRRNRLMAVNEEGKVCEPPLPVNVIATDIVQREFGIMDVICGNVLICDMSQVK